MSDNRAASAARLDAFVDAAFAFAVSLLVIAGAQPPADLDDLIAALGRIPAFAGSFALIAMFWLAHRDYGRLVLERDVIATLLSLAIVFTVLVFVFPLRQLTEGAFYWISGGRLPGANLIRSLGDLKGLYAIYGLGFALLAGFYVALFGHALRLALSEAARGEVREHVDIWAMAAGAGLLSALTAMTVPLAVVPWLPGVLYSLIPAGIGLRAWLVGRKAAPKAP